MDVKDVEFILRFYVVPMLAHMDGCFFSVIINISSQNHSSNMLYPSPFSISSSSCMRYSY